MNKTKNVKNFNKTKNVKNFNKTKNIRNFNKKEYNSGDGMLTSVWGPSMWHYLHVISFNYPIVPTKLQKNKYKNLF